MNAARYYFLVGCCEVWSFLLLQSGESCYTMKVNVEPNKRWTEVG